MDLSTGILVYKDMMSKLAKYLLCISMSVSLLSSDPEFFLGVRYWWYLIEGIIIWQEV